MPDVCSVSCADSFVYKIKTEYITYKKVLTVEQLLENVVLKLKILHILTVSQRDVLFRVFVGTAYPSCSGARFCSAHPSEYGMWCLES
jgi:hypothetical protein